MEIEINSDFLQRIKTSIVILHLFTRLSEGVLLSQTQITRLGIDTSAYQKDGCSFIIVTEQFSGDRGHYGTPCMVKIPCV